jgi:hypothetical protein
MAGEDKAPVREESHPIRMGSWPYAFPTIIPIARMAGNRKNFPNLRFPFILHLLGEFYGSPKF